MATGNSQAPSQGASPTWKLAKANLSKDMRLAVAGRPRRVPANGRDAVAVSTAEFERLNAPVDAPPLHDLLVALAAESAQFGRESVEGPVCNVEIDLVAA